MGIQTKDIVIGKIVGTYGNRGMVKIFPLTDFPDRFLRMDIMALEKEGQLKNFTVAQAKLHQKYVLVQFAEVADMTEAESLKGSLIKIGREELTPLSEGAYYIFDLIGLKVYTEDGGYIGEVEDILQTGANDVYVIGSEGGKPLLLPALKEVIKEIDLKGGRMIVVPQRE